MARSLGSLELEVLEQTYQDIRCPSAEVDGEPQLRVPRPEPGDRSLPDLGVQATGGRQRQQRRLYQRLDDVGVGQSDRVEDRRLFRRQPLGPDVREVEVAPYVFGLAEPPLSEPLSGDVRVPSPHVESSHQFVDGLGDRLPTPQSLK